MLKIKSSLGQESAINADMGVASHGVPDSEARNPSRAKVALSGQLFIPFTEKRGLWLLAHLP